MQSKNLKRIISVFLAVLMMASLLPIHQAFATTVTVLDGTVSISDSANTVTVNGNTVTATAKGSLFSKKTNTLTIANETDSQATLSFDYSASSANSFTIAGAAANVSGSYSVLLDAGATLTVAIQSKNGLSDLTATFTMSNIKLAAASASSNITFDFEDALGSVTVDAAAVADGGSVSLALGSSLALVATANSGSTFIGWVDAADGKILSTATSYSLTAANDMTVKAIFVNASSKPYFGVGAMTEKTQSAGLLGMSKLNYYTVAATYMFDDLNAASDAAAASASNKAVVLMNSGTLPAGDYTVDAGVTLLVPFDSTNMLFTTQPLNTASPAKDSEYKAPTAYRTLTMADGANLVINGAVSLSAKHFYAQGSKKYGAAVANSYGFVKMNSGSNITVNNGGTLYAYGYISGDGAVTVNNGGTVYEYFQFTDFRGGSQSTDNGLKNHGVFPLSQYYIQNIEVPMTLNYGAKEYSYTTIYMSSADFSSAVAFIGPSGSMFNLTSGSVTKRYDGSTDRLIVEANGNLTMSSIEMKVGTSSINSKDYELPIGSNLTVKVNSGCQITINQDMAMLPGSQIIVEEGANCVLGSGYNAYVYDQDEWGGYVSPANVKLIPVVYAPGKTYTRTEADLVDASVIVNGYFDVSAGHVYTTAGGANIYSTANGSIKTKPGTQTVTYQVTQAADVENSVYNEIPLTPAKLKNADGTYVTTTSPDGVYNYADGKWTVTCNHAYEMVNSGEADCENGGFVAYACPCGHQYTEITTEALGHTEVKDAAVAPTCTEAGLTEGSHCSVCNKVIVAQQPVAALGHTAVIDKEVAPTCTETGLTEGAHCSVCNEVIVAQQVTAALGHVSAVDAAVAPTCTETGLTEGSHCSVCNEVLVAQNTVDALGHDTITHEAKQPTYAEIGWEAYETCTKCDYTTYVELPKLTEENPVIKSVYLTLDEDIDISYRTVVPEGYTDAYMTFEFGGKKISVSDYTADEMGRYCFTFEGINPQCMGDAVTATLIATKDGAEVSTEAFEYSVKEYCAELLSTTEDEKLVTLLSDLLVYGAKAQQYKNYKTDALVTEGLTLSPSEFVAPTEQQNKFELTGTADESLVWKGAGLYLGSDVSVRFNLAADSMDGVEILAKIGDADASVSELYKTPYGKYYFYVEGITADQFDEKITVTLEKDGVVFGQSVSYSVNTYVFKNPDIELVRALYNYGVSASEYIA